MISFFTVPKAFTDNYAIIQHNAIRSWLLINPVPEIILFGDEPGIAEIAATYKLKHIPDIEKNEYGTPILSDIFEKAKEHASNDIICYINTDIIIFPDFIESFSKVLLIQRDNFLLTGNKWNIDIEEKIDFTQNWVDQLKKKIAESGKLNRPGIDYFIFHKSLYRKIPPFAIGRFAWDIWLVFEAQSLGCKVIDTTSSLIAVHQNHGYLHIGLDNINTIRRRISLELHDEIQQNHKLCKWKIVKPSFKWYIFNGEKVKLTYKGIIINNFYTLRRIISWSIQGILLKFKI